MTTKGYSGNPPRFFEIAGKPSGSDKYAMVMDEDGDVSLGNQNVSGGFGNVSGPGSSTDTAIAKWNGTGGDTLANSGWLISGVNRLYRDTGSQSFEVTATGFDVIQALASSAQIAGASKVYGEANSMFQRTTAGALSWGAGGGSSLDLSLSRTAANVLGLAADDSFKITGGTSDPGSPTEGQIFYRTDLNSLAYYDGSSWIRLTGEFSQTFNCAGGRDTASDPNVAWTFGKFPATAGAATVTPSNTHTFTLPSVNGTASITDTALRFQWESMNTLLAVTTGSQVAIAAPFHLIGNEIDIRARVRVDTAVRLSGLFIAVNDEDNTNNNASLNSVGSLVDNTWYELEKTGIDVSSFGEFCRIIVTAQGTTTGANVGDTTFDIEFMEVVQRPV